MNRLLANPLVRQWLAILGVATLILGAAYAMVQQSTRLSADDIPQARAQLVREELEGGAAPKDVVPARKTNLRYDYSVFIIITDSSQHVLASSATLDGRTPLPPQGVFSYATYHGTDHFTWEPIYGVRMATRVTRYGSSPSNGFVIAGQSLKPYEDRISNYGWIALAAWVAVLAWSYLLILLPRARNNSK